MQAHPPPAGNLAKAFEGSSKDSRDLADQLAAVLDEIRANQAEQTELLENLQRSLRKLQRQK